MTTTCIKVPPASAPCKVRFPGGIIIEAMNSPGDGDFERGLALFRAMSPALAALAPVFSLIGALLGLKKFVSAFTSFPPDVGELADGIDEFLTNVNKLIAIAPQVSVPLLIKDLLTCMINFLGGIISVLLEVQRKQQQIELAKQRAIDLNLPELDDLMDCAEDNLSLYLQHVAFTMGSFTTIYGILQTFADAAGIGELLGDVDFSVSGDLDTVIDKLSDIVMTLQDILNSIP